jgi:hypothetical protein
MFASSPVGGVPDVLLDAIGKLPASADGSKGIVIGVSMGTSMVPAMFTHSLPPALSCTFIFIVTGVAVDRAATVHQLELGRFPVGPDRAKYPTHIPHRVGK